MLTIVYQDCPLCGARKNWGERTIAKALKAGQEIRKLSFASPEGAHLCKEAIYAGCTTMPFITDGVKFSQNIEDFIETPKATKKRTRKAEVINGIV
jgi:hypothetical protein